MAKRKKAQSVRYVVGDCFGQPVVVEHIIPEMTLTAEKRSIPCASQTDSINSTSKGAGKGKPHAKRTCGQSQYSARDAKKQRENSKNENSKK